MNNIVNRINNEFGFNYQKFVRNNNISEITAVKPLDESSSKFNENKHTKPVKVETMDFNDKNPKEKNVEVLNLDK